MTKKETPEKIVLSPEQSALNIPPDTQSTEDWSSFKIEDLFEDIPQTSHDAASTDSSAETEYDEKIISVDQITDLSGLILPKGTTFNVEEINLARAHQCV